MGNAQSTSSVHSVPTTQCHHHKTRSLRSNNTRKGLKKFSSSATLAKLYHHHNISSATMPSKAIAWRNQHGEKILDIGKPTKFEHGIHVEFDDHSGKYMGLPDVWQGNFPSDDILDTTFIHPILVPTCECKINRTTLYLKKKLVFFFFNFLFFFLCIKHPLLQL